MVRAAVAGSRGPLSKELVISLDGSRVPAFDRVALRIDPTGQDRESENSDLLLNIAAAAPFLLGLDKRVRKEWLTLATLYVESALLTGGLQTLTTSAFPRYRPIAYIGDATLTQRTDQRNVNACYSGQTSNTAVATFFMAKVMDDLHPELGARRWLVYGVAAIPRSSATIASKGASIFRAMCSWAWLWAARLGSLSRICIGARTRNYNGPAIAGRRVRWIATGLEAVITSA